MELGKELIIGLKLSLLKATRHTISGRRELFRMRLFKRISKQIADGDMLPNLLEFSFGTDPTLADASTLRWEDPTFTSGIPVVERSDSADGGTFVARFLRRIDGSVSFAIQFSSDLTDWESSDNSPSWSVSPTVIATAGDFELVEIYPPLLLDDLRKPQFFRLQVTLEP